MFNKLRCRMVVAGFGVGITVPIRTVFFKDKKNEEHLQQETYQVRGKAQAQNIIIHLDDTNHLMPIGGEWVAAEVHHVVGGDRGWDPLSGVGSWSSGRSFNVGDKLWVTYSAAQESVSKLKSEEEFEACDVSNPIKMYTDDIDRISLDGEGTRYFVSCNDGLKLHVHVQPPRSNPEIQNVATSESDAIYEVTDTIYEVAAEAPTTPSGSSQLAVAAFMHLLVGSGH